MKPTQNITTQKVFIVNFPYFLFLELLSGTDTILYSIPVFFLYFARLTFLMPLAKYGKLDHHMHKSGTKIKNAIKISDWII